MENRPVRVLHVIHSLGCGGAEMMIMNLYRNIDRSLVQFDFLVHSNEKGLYEEEVLSFGGRIFRTSYFNGLNSIKYKKEVYDLLQKHPEIMIVHGHLGSCAHLYLSVAKKLGRYTIAHSHNTNPHNISLKNLAYRLFTLKTRKVADYFFACSQKAGLDRFGEKIARDNSKYAVFYNAIDFNKFCFSEDVRQNKRSELGLNNYFVIGHVGRFNEQKNHEYLIDLFSEYHKKDPNSVLVLVGDGELKTTIKRKTEDLQVSEAVYFLGVREDVSELLQAFDCMVFPSKYEGLPVTLIEAQATGLPCIISNTITDEVQLTDLVSKVSLSDEFSIWINKIIESKNHIRSNRKQELSKAGYDISVTSKKIVDFYLSRI